ncbi:helix-turn-helix domain-containing protein [Vibrio parahaemolyticus]|nr:helix-turn-helix domain-containing protein [Vibrio parahaemolyticus]MBE4492831.1 helix-turn-helix domain-containing protein [Vibrio parahaemolyticus]MBE4502157.1 helix-turn-helix domain-containing protein [Vibrio parahaemolyticus]MBE4506649.1 helix-turn-helix domain-containing protein [Vibrio parahaemolyticus]
MMEGTSFIAQDVNLECSFSDLLVRRPKVSDKALHVEAVEQPKVKTTRKRWTPEESEQLKTLYYEGKRVTTIADSLGRTVQAVQNQIRKLKLRRFRNLSNSVLLFHFETLLG